MVGVVDLRRRVAARRPRPERGAAARRPGPAGPRRRDRLPRRAGADHHDLPGRPAAQPRLLGLRRDVRRRCGRRPDPRRLAHRPRADLFGTAVDGWRLTFLINVPIGILAALAAPRLLRESESHPRRARPARRADRHPRPGRHRLRPDPRRRPALRLGRPLDASSRWSAGVLLLVAFVVIERRVAHPLLPFRILANRTRATSFVVMMLVPAAMFAMFYFLSLFVQNVMGFSPLQHRLRVPAVQRRHRGRRGHLLEAGGAGRPALARRGRHGDGRRRAVRLLAAAVRRPARPPRRRRALRHDILPFIVLMSLGMGLTFVPLTLTAVHGVGAARLGHRLRAC